MTKAKANYKKGNDSNTTCRFWKKETETQEHGLQNLYCSNL